MNPLNPQLCKLPLLSQPISSPQQENALSTAFNEHAACSRLGAQCNRAAPCCPSTSLPLPHLWKGVRTQGFIHFPPPSPSQVTEQNSLEPTSFSVFLSELVAADDTAFLSPQASGQDKLML